MSSSESGSGSESEPEFESIIATRARRSNAGSRLRQLLDLEETNAGLQNANDDDENVNLLFQEDEEDGEFEESGSDDDGDEQDGGEDESDDNVDKKVKSTSKAKDDSDVDKNAASDEMLSNSDISASDSDEEEGEKELQQQERLKKRRKRNTGLPAAAQKKAKSDTQQQKTKPTPRPRSKNTRLLITDVAPISPHARRHSSRNATVQSSIATHEKMEKEFERRQEIVPVARQEYVEKTLEERLEEAKITEKENMLSLTMFYQQEIQKKKKQRDMANSRKYKMEEYMRYWSTGVYVTPYDELEEIEEEKRKEIEEEEKKQRRKIAYLKRKQTRLGITDDSLVLAELEKDGGQIVGSDVKKESTGSIEEPVVDTVKPDDLVETADPDVDRDNNQEEPVMKNEDEDNSTSTVTKPAPSLAPAPEVITSNQSEPPASPETTDLDKPAKSVRFDTEDETPLEEEKPIYEGPGLKTARTYLIFESYQKLTTDDIKQQLFGQQSLLPGTRRDIHAELVGVIKPDASSSIDLEKIRAARAESLGVLLKLPKFGETAVREVVTVVEGNEAEVVVHTPAPVGIHLPDGGKKMCLVTGRPAVYYDPSAGTPYATVEAFKVIKGVVAGEYGWVQLDKGVGYYKGSERHAKGVPEGFA